MTTFAERAVAEIDFICRGWAKPPIEVTFIAQRGRSLANAADRRVEVSYPNVPEDFGAFLHEVVHVLDEPKTRSWAPWRAEAHASKQAMKLYRAFGWPDADAVAFSLGRSLTGYLADALSRGATTSAEVRNVVPAELLVYPEQLGIRAVSNGHARIDEDEIRGYLAGPSV